MLKKTCFLLTLMLLLSFTGAAYAAPPVQEQSQQELVETAREAGNFTTLIQGLEAANLTDTLENEGPFTIFAPTDEAFAALPTGTLEELFADPEALRSVLTYHVVDGNLSATDLLTLDTISTLQGATASVTTDGSTVMVGGAQVLNSDIQASNGVIHAIDTVLMPPGAMMGAESEMTEMAEPSAQPDSSTMSAGAGTCSEDYVIQADDSLSQIASKFLGAPQAYPAIVEATNAAAANNQVYVTIDDPNVIVVGQTLCIPGSTETETSSSASTPDITPTSGSEATSTSGSEMMAAEDDMMTIPEGQSLVVFENLSFYDLVFDLSGPTPDSLVVPPGAKQNFVLEPGQYNYNGHQPGGGFSVAPGQFELPTQQAVQVTCHNDRQCRVQSLNMPQMETQ